MAIAVGIALPAAAAAVAFRRFTEMADLHGATAAWAITLGKAAGLVAAMLLMLQFTLSARCRVLDHAFGLDRLLRLHGHLGAAAVMLACLHPLLLYGPEVYAIGPARWAAWPELLGAAILVTLCLIACTSIWRSFLRLSYRQWWRIHQLVFVAAVGASVHALIEGSDLAVPWVRWPWVALMVCYAGAFVWVKAIKPIRLARNRFTVAEVRSLNDNVRRIELAPPASGGFDHLPGQFAFLAFRGKAVSAEPHPFTIVSAPAVNGVIAFNIKASGDFTRTVPHLVAGDTATVDGPYGRFTYLLHAAAGEPLVLIAGGVGATPMLSMLAHLAATEPDRPVTFIWSNRTERDIFAAASLADLLQRMPALRVHHVLTRQADAAGRLNAGMLAGMLEGVPRGAVVFLCGPPRMMDSVSSHLRKLGFGRRAIHTERFAL